MSTKKLGNSRRSNVPSAAVKPASKLRSARKGTRKALTKRLKSSLDKLDWSTQELAARLGVSHEKVASMQSGSSVSMLGLAEHLLGAPIVYEPWHTATGRISRSAVPGTHSPAILVGPHFEGSRADSGSNKESPFDSEQIPPLALLEVSRTMKEGKRTAHEGQHPDDWRSVSTSVHLGRAVTHIMLHNSGDRGEPHLAHAATRLLMALEIQQNKKIQFGEAYGAGTETLRRLKGLGK